MSYGEGEDAQFGQNVERYKGYIEGNKENKEGLFKFRSYDKSYGAHGWKVFMMGTFEFLFYLICRKN